MGGVTTIPVEDDFLADDLDQLPDDGNRYAQAATGLRRPAQDERHPGPARAEGDETTRCRVARRADADALEQPGELGPALAGR
jgi:hypothetical protein